MVSPELTELGMVSPELNAALQRTDVCAFDPGPA